MQGWNRVIVEKDGVEITNDLFLGWEAAQEAHERLYEEHIGDRSYDVQLWVREA